MSSKQSDSSLMVLRSTKNSAAPLATANEKTKKLIPMSAKKRSLSCACRLLMSQPFPLWSMLNPNLRHCGYARKESFFAGLRHPNAQLASTLTVWGEGGQGLRESCQKELFFADTGLQKMGTLYLPKTSTLKQTNTLHCMLVWE